jgi:phosphocarrier protein
MIDGRIVRTDAPASDRGGERQLVAAEEPNMVTRTVRIGSSHGLHARPAKLFTQAAAAAPGPVTIAKGDGKAVNAASILGVISLGVEHGDYVTLSTEVDGAEAVLDELTELLVTDHDEA